MRAAYERLVAVAPELNADSTDLEIALAIGGALPQFNQLRDDRNLIGARQRLAELGLNSDSTNAEIAAAVAESETDPAVIAARKADRDLVAVSLNPRWYPHGNCVPEDDANVVTG